MAFSGYLKFGETKGMAAPVSISRTIARHTYGTWKRQEFWKEPLLIEDAEGV
jgi:hypothetical protein